MDLFLCIYSANMCLLIGAFNPFTYDMKVLITILLTVFDLFLKIFFFPSSSSYDLMAIFSDVFRLLFLSFVCIYCRVFFLVVPMRF